MWGRRGLSADDATGFGGWGCGSGVGALERECIALRDEDDIGDVFGDEVLTEFDELGTTDIATGFEEDGATLVGLFLADEAFNERFEFDGIAVKF